MAKSQETFGKKEREKKKLKKRKEKAEKREERKSNPKGGDFESMIAYVDQFGNISDTPPDPSQRVEIDAEDIVLGIPKKEHEDVPTVREGKIEFFNDSKGYGFIKEIGTGEKFFVHVHGMIDEAREGEKVSFELERGLKGMNAVKVKKI